MKKIIFPFFVLLLAAFQSFSQVITVTPALPKDNDAVEVVFDATQGAAGLKDYTGDVYAHTGVITNLSADGGDWKYVKAGWTTNIPDCKLVSLGNNKWKLTISPSIRAYYGVPASETIKKLAFVFRNADGSKEGKDTGGANIFYDVNPSALTVSILNPTDDYVFGSLGQTLPVAVASYLADSTMIYMDNTKIASTTGTSLTASISANNYGRYQVKAIAKQGASQVTDMFYYYVRPQPTIASLPAGVRDGINYLNDNSVVLCLYAPRKDFAFVLGDFNNWLPDPNYYMNKTPDGNRYWLQINGLTKGKEYIFQYLVNGTIKVADPYSAKLSDPWNDSYISATTYPNLMAYPAGKTTGIASVLQTGQTPYAWKTTSFTPPKNTDLVIYELLVRDFTAASNFQGVIDTLGYLKRLGVNAIELMPVNEFEGNLSWGYNPNFYFAVDKYYGPANKLKELVDACHQSGIAVISDLVLNHSYGTSPLVQLYWDGANSRPSADNPWYNVTSPNTSYSWGYDFNHESADTKALVDSINSYWMKEFKIDGFRFDFTKGFTNKTGDGWAYDASRIAILKRMASEIWKRNAKAYVIFEHLTNNLEEKELADAGIMLWGNMNNNYCEASMGYNTDNKSNLSWGFYRERGWAAPNLVTYMESHDEERQLYKDLVYGNLSSWYSTRDTATALKRAALTAAFFYTIPGPKMLWQFGERGYDYSINYPSGTSNDRLSQKPPRWDYMKDSRREYLYGLVSALIKLHINNPVFESNDFDYSLTGAQKRMRIRNSEDAIIVVGNFDISQANVAPNFYNTGKWYEYFTADSLTVTDVNMQIPLNAGEYRMYMTKKDRIPLAVGDKPQADFYVKVMPNPTAGISRIVINSPVPANCNVEICDLQGRLLKKLYNDKTDGQLELQWEPPQAGIYLLKVQLGTKVVVRKIVSVR